MRSRPAPWSRHCGCRHQRHRRRGRRRPGRCGRAGIARGGHGSCGCEHGRRPSGRASDRVSDVGRKPRTPPGWSRQAEAREGLYAGLADLVIDIDDLPPTSVGTASSPGWIIGVTIREHDVGHDDHPGDAQTVGEARPCHRGRPGHRPAISRQLLAAGCDVFVHYHTSDEGARGLEPEAARLGRRYGHASADLSAPRHATGGYRGHGLPGWARRAHQQRRLARRSADPRRGRRRVLGRGHGASTLAVPVASRARRCPASSCGDGPGGASIVNLVLPGRSQGRPRGLARLLHRQGRHPHLHPRAGQRGRPVRRPRQRARAGPDRGHPLHDTHTTSESARAPVAGIPLGRGGTAEDVARAAVFLAPSTTASSPAPPSTSTAACSGTESRANRPPP